MLLLFDKIGAAHEPNGALVAQLRKELEQFGRDVLPRCRKVVRIRDGLNFIVTVSPAYPSCGSQGPIDVEQADGTLHRAILQSREDTCSFGGHDAGGC